MYNIKAKDIRERLDKWLKAGDEQTVTELWAIMSDMQLWMADREEEKLIPDMPKNLAQLKKKDIHLKKK